LTLDFQSSTVPIMEPSIYSVTERSEKWPALLQELPQKSKPKQLYVAGELPPPDALVVGIVGTRRPTSYGKDATEAITRALSDRGIVIASGLAAGIDSIAHKTALEMNVPTIAVLGSGVSEAVLYPKENLELFRAIAHGGGAVISEYPPDQKPELWTFPQRNRIIAGIAKAVVVIEAGEKSGALITAQFATEFNRDVFALPGPISSAVSKGTNKLIKEGAIAISDPNDILAALGFEERAQAHTVHDVSHDEQKILDALHESLALDEIIKATRLNPAAVLASTTSLELRGIIKSDGGTYRKII